MAARLAIKPVNEPTRKPPGSVSGVELQRSQAGVEAATGHQLGMGALFHDSAAFKDIDAVSIAISIVCHNV